MPGTGIDLGAPAGTGCQFSALLGVQEPVTQAWAVSGAGRVRGFLDVSSVPRCKPSSPKGKADPREFLEKVVRLLLVTPNIHLLKNVESHPYPAQ